MSNVMESQRQWLELEAAFRLSSFVRREFGLVPNHAYAELCESALTVTMPQALTPTGLLIARDAQGAEALRCVYSVLYKANRLAMEALISQIAGMPARCRQMEVDLASADITISFELDAALGARNA